MPSFNAARCQHIKTSGTQCGSPALRGEQFCHYHRQSRPKNVDCYEDWLTPGHSGNITLPVFEDAHSVQFVVRQVTEMILQQKLDPKCAALALYGLQIASANLKRMETEKPRPTHVVIDPDKVAETPLGMTPWSATGKGHDPEDGERDEEETMPPASPAEVIAAMKSEERVAMIREYEDRGLIRYDEIEAYFEGNAPNPLVRAITRQWEERERKARDQAAISESVGEQELPPGSIQASTSPAAHARLTS